MEKVFLAAEYILEQRIKQPVLLPDLAITIIHSRISLMPDTKLKKELLPRLCEMACNRAALSKTRLQAIQILANSDQQLSEQDQEELLKLARNPQQIADAHDWTRLQLELIGTCMKQIDRAKIPSDLLQYLVEKTTANALYARRASASILLNIIRDGKSIQRISSGTYKLVATSSWWKNQARLNE